MPASILSNQFQGTPGGSRVLDGITSFAAFSVRRMRTDYTGPSMRVRRSSDDAEADIGFDETDWLDEVALLAHVGAGSGYVAVWYDQSGNAEDALQTVLVSQPLIVDTGVVKVNANGRPETFHNAEFARFVLTGITADFAFSVVGAPAASGAFRSMGTDAAAGAHYMIMPPGTSDVTVFDSSLGNIAGTWADGEVAAWFADHTKTISPTGLLGKNGAALVDTARAAPNPPTSLGNNSTTGAQQFGGVSEAIYLPAYTSPQRTALTASQAEAYSIVI